MHVEYTTIKTAEKRKIELEEASKRRAYRIAHGLEAADSPGIVPTTLPAGNGAVVEDGEVAQTAQVEEVRGPKRYKKWFGIW